MFKLIFDIHFEAISHIVPLKLAGACYQCGHNFLIHVIFISICFVLINI